MQSLKTEGIILKRRNFGEADSILTTFSKNLGKISVLAKGVRKVTSRRAGNIELLNRVLMYLHKGKNFWILTEATALDTFQRLKEDLTLSTYAYHIIELTDKLIAENQENAIIYNDLDNVFKKLEKNPRQIFIRAFEAKILSILGFVDFTSEEYIKKLEISEQNGGLLHYLNYLNWDQIEKLKFSEAQAVELERFLRFHIEKVIEGRLKARQFLKKI